MSEFEGILEHYGVPLDRRKQADPEDLFSLKSSMLNPLDYGEEESLDRTVE